MLASASLIGPNTIQIIYLAEDQGVTEIQTHPSATGVQQPTVLETAARFCVEVATNYGNGDCEFYYPDDFKGMTEAFAGLRGWQRITKDDEAP